MWEDVSGDWHDGGRARGVLRGGFVTGVPLSQSEQVLRMRFTPEFNRYLLRAYQLPSFVLGVRARAEQDGLTPARGACILMGVGSPSLSTTHDKQAAVSLEMSRARRPRSAVRLVPVVWILLPWLISSYQCDIGQLTILQI